MLAERHASPRARATALAVAVGVVAGGVVVASLPQLAAAVEDATGAGTVSGAIHVDTPSVPFSAGGFTPGNVVYAQVTDPSGVTNWSWGTQSFTVDDDGVVSGELAAAGAWLVGDYQVTLFESDDVQSSFTFTVEAAATEPAGPTIETTTPVETSTETATPTETADDTTAPTATEPGETEPTGTEPTGTEPATTEPTGTEPTDDDPATTAPTPDDTETSEPTATIGAPTAWADQQTYTPDEVAASGVGYHLTGFTPGVELQLALTLPSGEEAVFSSLEPIVPDANGEYSGVLTYSGAWPEGDYLVTVSTADGAEAEADRASDDDATTRQEASFTFAVARTPAPDNGGGGVAHPITTTGSQGTQGTRPDGTLASTGADVFGPAGLGLLVLGAGAAVVTGRWLLRRRSTDAS